MAKDKEERKRDPSAGQAQPSPAPPPASPAPPAGDRISVEVGEGASHVAAGKNIIQIGSLTVPRWAALLIVAALALVAVGVGIVAYYNQRTSAGAQAITTILSNTPTPAPTPTSTPLPQLTGVVKMAVTALGYQDETGAITPLTDRMLGENLSAILESAMREEGEEHLAQLQFSDYLSVGSYPGVLIAGQTAAEREQEAAELAQRANADLVVYGYTAPAGANRWNLQLYFYYYSPEIRTEPDAVSSSQLLGGAIPLDADPRKFPDQVLGKISNDLRLRGRALAWIGAGLYEDSLNSTANWQNALANFQTGLRTLFPAAQPAADPGAAADTQLVAYQQQEDKYAAIRAVFHYFIGREALWLRDYDLALAEQQNAIGAKADYANAYHALGAIHFDRAQVYFSFVKQPVPPELLQAGCVTQAEIDHAVANGPASDDEAWNDIDEAKTALEQALDLAGPAGQQQWSHVANVAHLTLGLVRQIEAQAYLQDGQGQLAGDRLGKAKAEFQTALAGFSAQPNQKAYVGWSHLGLGMVDLIGADLAGSGTESGADPKALLQDAIAHYDACIDLGDPGNPNYFNKQVVACGCQYYKAEAERLYDAKG